MKERISWKGEPKRYQPRMRRVRLRDLYLMKEQTGRPMTVLLDEALSVYLSTFMTSPEFNEFAHKTLDQRRQREREADNYNFEI